VCVVNASCGRPAYRTAKCLACCTFTSAPRFFRVLFHTDTCILLTQYGHFILLSCSWQPFNTDTHSNYRHIYSYYIRIVWHTVAQLVEALRYKPKGCGFYSRLYHLNFSFRGVDSASDGNEYQEYFLGGKRGRCVWLTTLSPSCADCLQIWEPQPPGTQRACPGL
jgi:hypothetical protein